MLLIILGGLVFTEIKSRVLRILTEAVRKIWSKWELRVMVLSSLLLQLVLVKFGKQRKHRASSWVAFLVWSTYLLADCLATVSLTTLLNGQEEYSINALAVFWAPLLLLHLGGPDITAYTLEESELWFRSLIGLFIQVGVAFYVCFKFRSSAGLTFVVIPIFVIGIIKYGERIWILRSSSTGQFRNSVPSAPPPDMLLDSLQDNIDLETYLERNNDPEARNLTEAFLLFKMFRPLFSEITLRFYRELSYIFTLSWSKSPTDAFKMVETELRFLYDVLYTKMSILKSPIGAILRFIFFLSSSSVLVAFWFVIGKHPYHKVDIAITYLLLVGAVILDIYAVIGHVVSEWTLLWLADHRNNLAIFVYRAISSRLASTNGEGLVSMAQYNLFHYCQKNKSSMLEKIERFFYTDNILRKYLYVKWEDVNVDLKNLIYCHLLEKRERYQQELFEFKFLIQLLVQRGDHALERNGIYEDFRWSIDDVEFSHSLLLWHIATDLCYQDDVIKYQSTDILGPCHKVSKSLSDYMLYLLVMGPFKLFSGPINEIRYRDTCIDAMRILKRKGVSDNIEDLLEFRSDSLMVRMGGTSKSVLYAGARLGQILQSLVTEEMWAVEDKWEMISQVWVEMLTYAASQCGWKEHAQELGRGRELLTHVALLMAHLGLSPKIQIVPLPLELQMLDY